jgi:ribosome-associated protein
MSRSWSARICSAENPDRRSNDLTTEIREPRELALCAAGAAAEKKASDIRILFLGELLGITDFFVIVSAANDRQLGTVSEEVERVVKSAFGRGPVRREGAKETGWMLLDYGDVVVHAFTVEQREFYNLERLWSDAPALPFDDLASVASSGE